MHLSASQLLLFSRILGRMLEAPDCRQMRKEVGRDMLALLEADYYASYVWQPKARRFEDRVTINMTAANLRRYEQYFQFRDPITPALQSRRRATLVSDVLEQPLLIKTEFYQDFLRPDGLHHGLNLYAYDGDVNIGDMRIWRRASREPFGQNELEMCELMRQCFTSALRRARETEAVGESAKMRPPIDGARIARRFGLTERQTEVAVRLAAGRTDAEIASEMSVGAATVRTHVRHVYRKLGVRRRVRAADRLWAVSASAEELRPA